jgi:hypothetical protein
MAEHVQIPPPGEVNSVITFKMHNRMTDLALREEYERIGLDKWRAKYGKRNPPPPQASQRPKAPPCPPRPRGAGQTAMKHVPVGDPIWSSVGRGEPIDIAVARDPGSMELFIRAKNLLRKIGGTTDLTQMELNAWEALELARQMEKARP